MKEKTTTFGWTVALASIWLCAGCSQRLPAKAMAAGLDGDDLAIRNVTVVDVARREVRPGQEIRVRGTRIRAVAPIGTIDGAARTVIDGEGMIALPGFVNTHTHLWQHVAKGFYPDAQLQEWVRIYRYAHYFTADDLDAVIRAAAGQALLSGITTISDFASSNFSEFSGRTTCDALNAMGVDGAVAWWYPAVFLPAAIRELEVERLKLLCSPLEIRVAPGPLSFFPLPAVYDGIALASRHELALTEHTMENVEEQRDLYDALVRYLDEHGPDLQAHDREMLARSIGRGRPSGVDNVEEIRRRAARLLRIDPAKTALTAAERAALEGLQAPATISPLPLLEQLGALRDYLSIHSVWSSDSDLEIYRRTGVAVSSNPESNQYLSSGIAPVLEMMQRGVVVALGTDGAASNDGIDFFSAMRALWNLQKLSYLDSTATASLEAWDVLGAATLGGARALGIDDLTGSLESGKEADVVLLDGRRLGVAPLVRAGGVDNLAALIVYSAGVRDVHTVLSNGRVVVADGRLRGHDERELAARLTEVAGRLVKLQSEGKTWKEHWSMGDPEIADYFARYRSVRARDRIDLEFTCAGPSRCEVTLMRSGTVFGGTVPEVLDPDVLRRFPASPPKRFFKSIVVLDRGQRLALTKEPGTATYQIAAPGASRTVEGENSEQIMIVVRARR